MFTLNAKIVLCATLLLLGCGKDEKSKDEQAAEFYDEKLQTEATDACNEKGFLYDALDSKCMDESGKEVRVATWSCTREGLGANVDSELNATSLTQLDGFIADGFKFHQCGQTDDGQVVVMIVNKGKTDDEATLEIRRVVFIGNDTSSAGSKLIRVQDLRSPGDVGECQSQTIEHAVGTADAAPVATPVEGALKIRLGTSEDSAIVKFYKEAGCADGTDETFVIMEKGQSTVEVHYVFSEAGDATMTYEADGYQPGQPVLIGTKNANAEPETEDQPLGE